MKRSFRSPRRTHDDRHNGSRDAGRVNGGRRGDMPCMAFFPHLFYAFVPEKGAAGPGAAVDASGLHRVNHSFVWSSYIQLRKATATALCTHPGARLAQNSHWCRHVANDQRCVIAKSKCLGPVKRAASRTDLKSSRQSVYAPAGGHQQQSSLGNTPLISAATAIAIMCGMRRFRHSLCSMKGLLA